MNSEYVSEELSSLVRQRAILYLGGGVSSISSHLLASLANGVIYILQAELPEGLWGNSLEERFERCLFFRKEKLKKAKKLFEDIFRDFSSYGLMCLEDTFVKGMEAFFATYDVEFFPREDILSLDYPLLSQRLGKHGVDLIFDYLKDIKTEQEVLRHFPPQEVAQSLSSLGTDWRENIFNVLQRCFECRIARRFSLPLKRSEKEKFALRLHMFVLEELKSLGAMSEENYLYCAKIPPDAAARFCIL